MELNVALTGNVQNVQFELNSPIQSLWVSAVMDVEAVTLLYLFNPCNRLCGSISLGMGRFIKEIYISESVCTMNGLRHALMQGTYTLLIVPAAVMGAAHIQLQIETNVDKSYSEEYLQDMQSTPAAFEDIVEDSPRYYKGDFHGHTIFSDGHRTIQEAIEALQKKDMDFMAFTEHNMMPFDLPKLPCLSLPSFELTLPIGHLNIHGVEDLGILFGEFKTMNSYEAVWEGAVNCFGTACNLSLNHMFMEPWHFSYSGFDMSKLNTIEVICDPTYPSAAKANNQAVDFLDFLWQEGLIIFGIGGSDSHNKEDELYDGAQEPSVYGDPATYVYCEGLSVRNIIEGIRKGHSYITRYGNLIIEICEGKYLPGDQISEKVEFITYRVRLENIQIACTGRFILNGETVWEAALSGDGKEAFYVLEPVDQPWWLRFGLYDTSGNVIAYVNPVYNRVNKCQNTVFKNLYDRFGERYDQRNIIR
ncbi:MAG TPA: CehA/McbA family metallohydrolase [Mobilitalea sp.]|nr:CehA/McbA family metallohydrolase [Mobilitalea sp.]